MKKMLLLMLVGAAVSANAQQQQGSARSMQAAAKEPVLPSVVKQGKFGSSVNKSVITGAEANKQRNTPRMLGGKAVTPPGTKLVETYYDFQTNAALGERVIYRPETKVMEVLWMAAPGQTDWSDRATYYTGLNASNPDKLEIDIDAIPMEKLRAGFPSAVALDNGAIGTPSHVNTTIGTAVKFTRNNEAYDDNFTTYNIVPESPQDSSLWARAARDGAGNIHVIYTYNFGSKINEIGYSRSSDGGKTWTPEVLLTGSNAIGGGKPSGHGADAYAIAARGNTVAIVYSDSNYTWWWMKSTDNGQSWAANQPILAPKLHRLFELGTTSDGKTQYTSDTLQLPGTNMDVIIDSQGKVHGVTNIFGKQRLGVGDKDGSGNIVFISGRDSVRSFIYYKLGCYYFAEGDTLIHTMAPPAGSTANGWDGQGSIVSNDRLGSGSATRFPQLGIGEDNTIYCIYTSIKNGDISNETIPVNNGASNVSNGLFGHLYATHRPANVSGDNWSEPVSLTPDGVDCLYGTLANDVADGHLFYAYSADDLPGDKVTEGDAYPVRLTSVYASTLAISALNTVNVLEDNEIAGFATEVYPNPTSGSAIVHYSVPSTGKVSIEVFSLIGQKIASFDQGVADGARSASINTDAVPAGAYYISVKWNGHSITKLLTVIK